MSKSEWTVLCVIYPNVVAIGAGLSSEEKPRTVISVRRRDNLYEAFSGALPDPADETDGASRRFVRTPSLIMVVEDLRRALQDDYWKEWLEEGDCVNVDADEKFDLIERTLLSAFAGAFCTGEEKVLADY